MDLGGAGLLGYSGGKIAGRGVVGGCYSGHGAVWVPGGYDSSPGELMSWKGVGGEQMGG